MIGRFSRGVFFSNGSPARNYSVQVFKPDDTPASLYGDVEKTIALSNPISTDSWGNLDFYADQGDYYFLVGDDEVEFAIDPLYYSGAATAESVAAALEDHIESPRPHQAAESGRDFAAWFNAGIA